MEFNGKKRVAWNNSVRDVPVTKKQEQIALKKPKRKPFRDFKVQL